MKIDDVWRVIDNLSYLGGIKIEKKKKLWCYYIKCFGLKV